MQNMSTQLENIAIINKAHMMSASFATPLWLQKSSRVELESIANVFLIIKNIITPGLRQQFERVSYIPDLLKLL